MKKCFSCGRDLDVSGRPGRGGACIHCGADLKVCFNCAFYDRDSYNECRETSAERVLDKDRSNYCEYFEWRDGKADSRAGDGLDNLKALFKE